jgi:hypothetical protein
VRTNRPWNDRPVPCGRTSRPNRLEAIKPFGGWNQTHLPVAFDNKPHRPCRLNKLYADARAVFGVITDEGCKAEWARVPSSCGPCLYRPNEPAEGRALGSLSLPTWDSQFTSFALWWHPCLVNLHSMHYARSAP